MNKLRPAKNVSIRTKLTVIIVSICTIALLLAGGLFTLVQQQVNRTSMIENLTSVAKITADNLQAAVLFANENDADNILSELKSDSRINAAAIYTTDNQLFSAFNATEHGDPAFYDFSQSDEMALFSKGFLYLYQPIKLDGKNNIGFLYLNANATAIKQQLHQNITFISIIIIFVLFITVLLTSKLQKLISTPILDLSQATDTIKNAQNYSIRVHRDDYLEIAQLCDGFNAMLAEIQSRDQHLEHLAMFDSLTGIPNRTLFTDHFQRAIAHSKRTKTQLAICFLDIDNFKPINDNFGHEIGDKVLVEVAHRITENIREEDSVSRQGGDEFAILIGGVETSEQCMLTLDRIHNALNKPFLIDNEKISLTPSCGVTFYPSDDGDIDTLIRHADQAMYHAKLAGKNRYHLFNPSHDKTIIQKHHRLSEIEQALENDEFCLYYQPKINMVTGEVFGAEALIRWLHPENGLTPPMDFLPIIEGTNLEIQVGEWVISRALNQLTEWIKQGIHLQVSVNISPHHLQSENFLTFIEHALTFNPSVESHSLQIEILESSALGDLHVITKTLTQCQEKLGIDIALDDFGTGYSSLTHLRSLPANTVKIDQSFVRDMLDDSSDYAIIDGIISLANAFHRDVIAEGVETTEHGLMLLISGCDKAQGYGISRPIPANELPLWLKNYTPNPSWISFGNEQHSPQEKQLKLLSLVIQKWKVRFKSMIYLSPDELGSLPDMENNQCYCGYWIKIIKQDRSFEKTWQKSLQKKHLRMHQIADEIWAHQQHKNRYEVKQALTELDIVIEELEVSLISPKL